MAASSLELESKYTFVQSIGIRCDDVRRAHDTIARRLKPDVGRLQWLGPSTVSLCLPGVLADLQLCFTDGGEALIPGQQMLDEASTYSGTALSIEPEEAG
jgi:hypothetical protein